MAEIPRKRNFWRGVAAVVIAIIFWGIISLSDSFVWSIEVPLDVRLGPARALAAPIPNSLRVTVRAEGWTMMQLLVGSPPIAVISQETAGADIGGARDVLSYSERELRSALNLPSDIQVVEVFPSSLQLVISNTVSKRVPLRYPGVTVRTRDDFKVIGGVKIIPDSVTISGSREVLENIDHWLVEELTVEDAYDLIREQVQVDDTLSEVIDVEPDLATVVADVQEIAEVEFLEIPIRNRSTIPDTNLRLVLQPADVSVTLRGGVRDLARMQPEEISAVVELVAGVDTSGYVRPRIELPPQLSAAVIRVEPRRIRYFWRR